MADDNSKHLAIIGIAFFFFLLCSKVAWQEISHYFWGNVTYAMVTDVSEARSTSRRGTDMVKIDYQYVTEDGDEREGSDKVELDWDPPEYGLQISYLDGANERSKIHGVVNYFAVICFLGCGVVVCVLGLRLWLLFRNAPAKKTRYGSRR